MKRLFIFIASVALTSTAALAADLPVPVIEEVPVVEAAPVVYDWSGFYIGINGGYAWGDTDVDFDYTGPGGFFGPCIAAGACLGALDYETDGFLIGGHAGMNWQAGAFVFGLEADIDYSDMEGDAAVRVVGRGLDIATTASTEYDYFGTFRGRIGAAFDRVLVYGTGGLAFADVENFSTGFDLVGGFAFEGGNDETQVGWTAGGGVEFAVTDNVTLGAEALYFDLGDEDVRLNSVGAAVPAGTFVDANFENTGVLARGRVSVKFGSLFGG